VRNTEFYLALANLPTLHLYAAAPPQVLELIKSILEEFYTDGIDQVLSAELDRSGNIVGEFGDRVGARQVKRYAYQITDSEVTYKLLNPNEVSSFAFESFKPLFGVGARAGKKKNCAKSTPCGDSCIAVGKVCRKKPGSATKAKIAGAKKGLGDAKKGSDKADKPTNAIYNDRGNKHLRGLLVEEHSEGLVSKAEKNFQAIVDNTHVHVALSAEALEGAVGSGKLKSVFEMNAAIDKSKLDEGDLYNLEDYEDSRTGIERMMFGNTIETLDPDRRPVYGYLAAKDYDANFVSHDTTDNFGEIKLVFSKVDRRNITVTDNDSWVSSSASPIGRVSAASLAGTKYMDAAQWDGDTDKRDDFLKSAMASKAKRNLDAAANSKTLGDLISGMQSPFVEAHLHGGSATLDKVGAIIVPKGAKLGAKTQKWIKDNGIQIIDR
jgi:hypothetical protein